MLSMKHIFTILGLIIICSYSTAQPYDIKNLSRIDGLSNDFITDIAQDGQGFVWIGTQAGLSRFDGKNFTSYNALNSELHNSAINKLLYDEEDDKLWIGTNLHLSILDCSTMKFENFTHLDGYALQNIHYLAFGSNDNIWIINVKRDVICYNKKTKKAVRYSKDEIEGFNGNNYCCYDDGKGNLYLGHMNWGMTILNLDNHRMQSFVHNPTDPKSIPGNNVYDIKEAPYGNLWVGTDRGLTLFDPQKNEFIVFRNDPQKPFSLADNRITQIQTMQDGSLWIATEAGGINKLNDQNLDLSQSQNLKFTHITTHDGLSSNSISSIMQDSFGNIWIGNSENGIDVISHVPPKFHVLPYNIYDGKKVKTAPVWGVYVDNNGQIWAGCENKAVLFENNNLKETYEINKGKDSSPVFALTQNTQGDMFFGMMKGGLIKMDGKTKRMESFYPESGDMNARSIHKNKDGEIWIGTTQGLYVFSNGKITNHEYINRQIGSNPIYGICRDRQGKLWIGTFGVGIYVFDKDETSSNKLSFFSNAISHMFIDSRGGLWVATRNRGVGYIKDTNNPDVYVQYGLEQGLNDLFVRAIQEDNYGNIWFTTNSGISFLNRATDKINNYDHHDGIPLGSFIEGSAAMGKDGTIYFGSQQGVCYFTPEKMMLGYKTPPVQIVECQVFDLQLNNKDGEEYFTPSINQDLKLKYYQNSFRISFSSPDYALNQQVEYAYMIEGLGNVWSNTAGENQVTFRNIPPGKYTFKVKTRLKNQEWDEEHIALLNIQIHPPLWLTPYAKFFYLLVMTCAIYLFIRSYKRRLKLKSSLEIERRNNLNEKELNQERLRFYTNITHELRTPLTLILGPLEDLKNDTGLSERYNKKISTIHANAVRLLNLINQLLEFRKTETQNRKLSLVKGNIENLVKEIVLHYTELNSNEELKFQFNLETENPVLYFDPEIVTIVLNNLLSNAMKYTATGEITTLLRTVEDQGYKYIELSVSDTGVGISPEALLHIFDRYYQVKGKHQASGTGIGLSIVKSLADLHKGSIWVESELGKGSTFIFRLPANTSVYSHLVEESPTINENNETDSLLVLVIEDNADIREYIASSLSEKYTVITAANGDEGLQKAQEKIPNIIISDVMMPGIDGIELCRSVKEDIRTSHIPVILLTAKDTIHDKEKGYESGADSYITKPFSARLLEQRIQNLLDNRCRQAKQVVDDAEEGNRQSDSSLNVLDEQFLSKLTTLINEKMDDPDLEISYLKEEMNMSYSTFSRKVKALTGFSPIELIRKIRLKKSLEYLLDDDNNISEAGYKTGFTDPRYFRRCFKEEYGMTPSEYINKKKQK